MISLKPLFESDNVEMAPQLINEILQSVSSVHASHLMTTSYPRHEALDIYYKSMPELIDQFAECYLCYNVLDIKPSLSVEYTSDEAVLHHLMTLCNQVHSQLDKPDLINPLEGIMSLISQTLYRLRFTE